MLVKQSFGGSASGIRLFASVAGDLQLRSLKVNTKTPSTPVDFSSVSGLSLN